MRKSGVVVAGKRRSLMDYLFLGLIQLNIQLPTSVSYGPTATV